MTWQSERIVLEDRARPLAVVSQIMPIGCVHDPPGKEGLSFLTNQMLARGAGKLRYEDIVDELDQLRLVTKIAPEEDDAADRGVPQPIAPGVVEFATGNPDQDGTAAHAGRSRSNSAMDSTWPVCGNMSITPAPFSVKPCSRTRMPASRARLAGWQDT